MNLIVIQARMGSTRLPGKVLMKLNGKPILQNLIERISPAKLADKIVVATTTNPEDDAIETFCKENNVACFRGSDWDVLSRFYDAAVPFKPDTVIRVTSDCPLHHHSVVDFAIREYQNRDCDYFSNSNHEPGIIEDGFDTEVFSFTALEKAYNEAKMLSEREHVTPYIKHSGKFKCEWKAFDPEYKYKLSVDSPEDFKMAEAIFSELSAKQDFGMRDVIELLKQKPQILELNKNSIANSGYQKSIQNDKPVR